MAGAFTHWMIAREAFLRFTADGKPGEHLNERLPYFLLGAVSPDLPYLVGGSEAGQWADRMHYEKIDLLVRNAAESVVVTSDRYKATSLAWLLGFVSHVVSDVVVHPVVNKIVGAYRFNAKEHLRCEMIQDVLLFKEIMGKELVGSDFHKIIVDTANDTTGRGVNTFIHRLWKQALTKTYVCPLTAKQRRNNLERAHHEILLRTIDPPRWFDDYLHRLGLAGSNAMVTRHTLGALGLAYSLSSDEAIDQNDKSRFYYDVPMPDGSVGAFKEKVFSKAVTQTVTVWKSLLKDTDKKKVDNIATYVKNWDLDLGVDLDAPYLWV